jgi:hypothetical protein
MYLEPLVDKIVLRLKRTQFVFIANSPKDKQIVNALPYLRKYLNCFIAK